MKTIKVNNFLLKLTCLIIGIMAISAIPVMAQTNDSMMPRLVKKDGRYALFVDGAPYLMLGAQINNSSAWPSALPKVWPAVKYIQANTVEMPVYWEQFEPQPGVFDYSVVDTLLAQSRENNVRLVLLWFGTWKNGNPNYMPLWMKQDPVRFPRVIGPRGRPVASPSPFSKDTLEADKGAFTALMRHLKTTDPQHTVIMVQVENEAGAYGSVRDYSPAAQKMFEAPVPAELLTALNKKPGNPKANWQEVFGPDAEEFFHAWSVAHFIGQVAAAGKAEYPLPLYANAALRDPFNPGSPINYESGGPTDNVIPIWKAAAPAIDLVAPDIYMTDSSRYLRILELYRRPDNALFVPETGNTSEHARFFFSAIGHQAIGFSPFGIDYTGYSNYPLGAMKTDEETLAQFALNNKVAGPMMREIARLNFEGKLQAVAEVKENHTQTLDFGAWKVIVTYGVPQFGFVDNPPGNPEPKGRALVAQLGVDQFLVTGLYCRIDFQITDSSSSRQRVFLRVEEGMYENGAFKVSRLWNGDQEDSGLNFTSIPQVLRVTMGTF